MNSHDQIPTAEPRNGARDSVDSVAVPVRPWTNRVQSCKGPVCSPLPLQSKIANQNSKFLRGVRTHPNPIEPEKNNCPHENRSTRSTNGQLLSPIKIRKSKFKNLVSDIPVRSNVRTSRRPNTEHSHEPPSTRSHSRTPGLPLQITPQRQGRPPSRGTPGPNQSHARRWCPV